MAYPCSDSTKIQIWQSGKSELIHVFETMEQQIDLFGSPDDTDIETNKGVCMSTISNKVFIVHGRDNETKIEVARFLEHLEFEPIILHEQANEGKTIIEKIETFSDVGFAIVLYTPCDLGKLNGTKNLKNRAQQNVVFEHGYLIGKIGRDRVNALVKGDIELPNDLAGVVYTQMDDPGAWKFEVAKEMRAIGYPVDMNKI